MSLKSQDNVTDLAHSLSTTSTLLFLLQSTLKASNTTSAASHRNRNSPATLFGRMAQVSFQKWILWYIKTHVKIYNCKYKISGFPSIFIGHGNFKRVQWNGGEAEWTIKSGS